MAASAENPPVDAIEPDAPLPAPDAAPAGIAPLSPRRLAAVVLAVLGLAAATWAFPPVGLIAAWPMLFFVPGWVLIQRVSPHLPAPGRVGLAVVTSVYLSAHLVNLVARVDGFGREAVLVSVAAIALATILLLRFHHPWLAAPVRPSMNRVLESARRDLAGWVVSAAVGLTVLGILGWNGWRQTTDGFVSGGWNWSDLLVHVSIGSSIVHGNFPPEVPFFAGVPLTYHWFADFHGAIAATVARVDIIPVFFLTSALFAAVLAMLVWSLALTLTHRRGVATIAVIIVCFGGGLGWLHLIGDVLAGGSTPLDLVTRNSYDNSWAGGWPFFRIASMMSTAFLPQRATTLGLPGLVAVVLLVVSCLGRRPAAILLAGVLAALVAPFDFYAYPASYAIVLTFVIFAGRWRSPFVARDAALFLVPIVLSIPFVAGAIAQQGDLGTLKPVLGWSDAPSADGPAAVLFFYLTNLGLPFVLALIAVGSRGLPNRWFLVAWVAAMFLVPNLVVVSSSFDMNRFFQMMWIAVAVLAAWLIRRWPAPVVAAVLAFSAISPVLVGLWHLWNPAVVLSVGQQTAGRWIEVNTPDDAIFITDSNINSPVDLAGRRRISTFGPFVSHLGYDPEQRGIDTTAIYCDGAATATRLMARYAATYVLSPGGVLDCGHDPTDFGASNQFETVYDANGVKVWRLAG